MDETARAVARLVYAAAIVYAVVGISVAVPFAASGIARVDRRGRDSSLAFRLSIVPGAICLWPAVLWRWRGALRGGDMRHPDDGGTARGLIWAVALALAALVLAAALIFRPAFPIQAAPPGAVPLAGGTTR